MINLFVLLILRCHFGAQLSSRRSVSTSAIESNNGTQLQDYLLKLDSSNQPQTSHLPIQSFDNADHGSRSTKPTNQRQEPTRLIGYPVVSECEPNLNHRQELPCLLHSSYLNEVVSWENGLTIDQRDLVRDQRLVTVQAGNYVYLPCWSLSAESSENITKAIDICSPPSNQQATIWEKDEDTLFASTSRFTTNQRLDLITQSRVDFSWLGEGHIKGPVNKQWSSASDMLLSSNVRKNDLIINFAQPIDSGVYKCQLIGRTRQLIEYKVKVKEHEQTIFNGSRKLELPGFPQVPTPPLKTFSQSTQASIRPIKPIRSSLPFNLTCIVKLGRRNIATITTDWFRPTARSKKPANEDDLEIETRSRQINRIEHFADSFNQLPSTPNLRVYKQLSTNSQLEHTIQLVASVARAKSDQTGLYECRVYEPIGGGFDDQRILDRALIDLVGGNKPRPGPGITTAIHSVNHLPKKHKHSVSWSIYPVWHLLIVECMLILFYHVIPS